MSNMIVEKAVFLRNYLIYQKKSFLAAVTQKKLPLNPKADFVITLASYPNRIHLLPAVFESLACQTAMPRHAYIVLSEEEWPGLKIPKVIQKLVNRGVEIVWTKNNQYAVKKIVPIIGRHLDLKIITLDDDVLYGPRVLEELVSFENKEKGCIVGHVGKALHRRATKLGMMFRDEEPANLETNSSQVYLIGWGGILYPPASLDPRVTDMSAINRIVPGRGSDIWFWAAAVAAGTKQFCLGTPTKKELGIEIPQSSKTMPRDRPGHDVMEERFQETIDFFGVRELLLEQLPDRDV